MTRVWQVLLAAGVAVAFAAAGALFYQWRTSDAPPDPAAAATPLERQSIVEALEYMKLPAGIPIKAEGWTGRRYRK